MLPDHLPRSRVPDPAEAPLLRWGVIGTGWIAERFVDALQSMTRQQVVAVGSRTNEGAEFLGALSKSSPAVSRRPEG
jgi:predicted dehydrogenase